jgi:hypothetical protein
MQKVEATEEQGNMAGKLMGIDIRFTLWITGE